MFNKFTWVGDANHAMCKCYSPKHIWRSPLFIAAVLLMMLNLPAFGDTNILANPGFENGADASPWVPHFGSTVSGVQTPSPHGGSWCGASTGRTGTYQGMQQDLYDKVVPGATYNVSGYFRTSTAGDSTISITWRVNGNWTGHIGGTANSSGWTYISGTYTVPAEITDEELYVYIEGPASGVDIYIDDLVVYGPEVSPPNPNLPVLAAPSDGQGNISILPMLQWESPTAYTPTGYDVYLGTDSTVTNNPVYFASTEEYTPGTPLALGTTYYWAVVAYDSTTGYMSEETWSFTTINDTPVGGETLRIDFGTSGSPVQSDYAAYTASHESSGSFTTQSYSVFETTVSVTPSWASGAVDAVMQMLDRGPEAYEDATEALMQDWIGSDTRSAGDPLTLTISGLPAGEYTWVSYHTDTEPTANIGTFDVTVNDATGSVTTTDIQCTNSSATTFDSVAKFETTLVSDGSDVSLVFDCQPYSTAYNEAWFVMNGFKIEFNQEPDPNLPVLIYPSSVQEDVSVVTALQWTAPMAYTPTSYEVFLGTNSVVSENPSYSVGTEAFDPAEALDNDTTYYWAVIAYDGTTPYASGTRSFTTISADFPEFTDDNRINIDDLTELAADWLSCSDPITDVTGDGCVNMRDFSVLSQNWLWERPVFQKHRVINTTDLGADNDDLQSLVRMLVTANECDIEGIIVGTSCWKKSQTLTNMNNLLNPRLNAYGQVYDKLIVHAEGYPTLAYLQSISKLGQTGYGMAGIGEGKDSDGSELIIAAVDKDDPRPVWVNFWGGGNTLAQALWKVKNTRTPAQVDQFVSKLRVYDILGQDETGAWMTKTFPSLFYIRFKGVYNWQSSDSYYDNNIQNHGVLGAQYPEKEWTYEGDTPAFFYQLLNGLNDPEHVNWGGWGGRMILTKVANSRGMSAVTGESAYDPYYMYGDASEGGSSISRWKTAIENDFAARMDWTLTSNYSSCNHHPVAVVNDDSTRQVLTVSASAGSSVALSAAGSSDPDGNSLVYSWAVYAEPSSYKSPVSISGSTSSSATVSVPSDAGGKTIYIYLNAARQWLSQSLRLSSRGY